MVNNAPGEEKVSVVVCTYNGEAYLQQQLESIQAQTWKNLEIIICDDSSTDNTVTIARRLAGTDDRIRVHVNESNLGYNENFSHAFELATGNYIAISDQDDIWKPEKIAGMMKLFIHENTLLVHAQSVRFSGTPPTADEYTARILLEGSDPKKILFFNTIAGHNIIFRKTLLAHLLPFPKDVFYDWWLVINASVFGYVGATSKVFTFHREHESNVTLGKKDEGKQTLKKARERIRTLEEVINRNILQPEDQKFAKALLSELKTLENKDFSMNLFRFLFRHAATLFFFKKKKWPSVSHAKIAYRHSFAKK